MLSEAKKQLLEIESRLISKWIKIDKKSLSLSFRIAIKTFSKEVEELDEEEITYNFEVEDYHTYFVGEKSILVHNDCRSTQRRKYWKKEATELKGKNTTYKATDENIKRMERGLAPKGYDGKSVELHHVKGISKDFDDIV